MNDTINVCIIHQNDGTDVRIGKLCRTLSRKYSIIYIGWDRNVSSNSPNLGGASSFVLKKRGGFGKKDILSRLYFLAWANFQVIKLKPKIIISINEDVSFSLLPACYLVGSKLLVDIHDPISDRLRGAFSKFLAKIVQNIARKKADKIFVTDQNRYDKLESAYHGKAVIINNFPNKPEFSENIILNSPSAGNDIVISVIGTIHRDRGIDILSQAIRGLNFVKIICAGWCNDQSSKNFIKQESVDYLGVLDQQDSMRAILKSDLVFCYYSPETINNINASPNKIYEALALGRKVLINSETIVSQWVAETNLGYIIPYYDIQKLRDILLFLSVNKDALNLQLKFKADSVEKNFLWEELEPKIFHTVEDLFNEL
jgi:glycosyltransferase involved in cell wall biosynthesis